MVPELCFSRLTQARSKTIGIWVMTAFSNPVLIDGDVLLGSCAPASENAINYRQEASSLFPAHRRQR